MFAKTEVNGDDAHPVYKFLRAKCAHLTEVNTNGSTMLGWNFAKFLCDREGKPVFFAVPDDLPEKLEK